MAIKQEQTIWLIITKLPRAFEADLFGNYLVKAISREEATHCVLQTFLKTIRRKVVIEYVTSAIENPMLVRGVQFDKCAPQLNIELNLLEDVYEFCDINLGYEIQVKQ